MIRSREWEREKERGCLCGAAREYEKKCPQDIKTLFDHPRVSLQVGGLSINCMKYTTAFKLSDRQIRAFPPLLKPLYPYRAALLSTMWWFIQCATVSPHAF